MPGIYELKKTVSGQFHFVLKADNGEVILSSEQYKLKSSAEKGIASVRTNAILDERFLRKTAKDGSPFFVLTATNGKTIGQSEMYSSSQAMDNGIASVKVNGPTATLSDLSDKPAASARKVKSAPKTKAAAPKTKAAAPKTKAAAPKAKAAAPKTKAAAPKAKAAAPKAKASPKPKG